MKPTQTFAILLSLLLVLSACGESTDPATPPGENHAADMAEEDTHEPDQDVEEDTPDEPDTDVPDTEEDASEQDLSDTTEEDLPEEDLPEEDLPDIPDPEDMTDLEEDTGEIDMIDMEEDLPPEDPCDDDPCLEPQGPRCDPDGVTLITYTGPGTCADEAGEAVCTFPEDERTHCPDMGDAVCQDNACAILHPTPEAGEVVITEFMYNPVDLSDADAEWIELYNNTDEVRTLHNCTLEDASESRSRIRWLTLQPRQYTLLARDLDNEANGNLNSEHGFSFSLGNSGDSITLVCDETQIDTITYDETWPTATGRSLALNPDHLDATSNDDATSWCYGEDAYYDNDEETLSNLGTPGRENPACVFPDTTVDWCQLDRPWTVEVLAGTLATLRTLVREDEITNLTPGPDPSEKLRVEIGYGSEGSNPADSRSWNWFETTLDAEWDPDTAGYPGADRFLLALEAPGTGSYSFAARATLDNGESWFYCDRDGLDNGYQTEQAGTLRTQSGPCSPNPCNNPGAPFCNEDGVTLTTYEDRGICSIEGVAPVCDYDAYDTNCAALGGAICLNGACVVTSRQASPGEIFITEIMYNPSFGLSDSNAEYIEIYNAAEDDRTLHECILSDDNDNTTELRWLTLPAQSYVLLVRDEDSAQNGGLNAAHTFSFGLGNGGDTVKITCGDTELARVDYDNGTLFPESPGVSIQLSTNAFSTEDNNAAANWCLSETSYFTNPENDEEHSLGTPGQPNRTCPNVCDPNPCQDAGPPRCAEDGLTLITGIAPGICEIRAAQPHCTYQTTSIHCGDTNQHCFQGSCVDEVPSFPIPGDLVITEVLYDPHHALSDGRAEWFEVQNLSNRRLNLGSCLFSGESGNPSGVGEEIVEPGAYAVFARSTNPAENGGIEGALPFGFTLGNGDGAIRIECNNELIDDLIYDTNVDFPDLQAISANLDPERRTPEANNDANNWCPSTTVYFEDQDNEEHNHFGTPGQPNTPCTTE